MDINGGSCDLPGDLIIEILSRLPVKSLIKFRCVCKSWPTLLKHPNFISKHLNHNNKNKNARLLVYRYDEGRETNDFLLFSDETPEIPTYQNLGITLPILPRVCGPCNGILCLCNYNGRIALWNPATREFRELPLYCPDFPPPWKTGRNDNRIAFGFDPTTNDYKVIWIRISSLVDIISDTYIRYAAIYNLSTDSWREFDGDVPQHDLCEFYSNSWYLNGTHYWWTDFQDTRLLISFHMGDEEFREVLGPPSLGKSMCTTIAVYNGCISWIDYADDPEPDWIEPFVHVWVMVEQGCWSKQLCIGPIPGILRVFGFWTNGDLFVRAGTWPLGLYGHDAKVRQYLGPLVSDYWEFWECLQVFIYTESLVSVKGGNSESQEQEVGSSYDIARHPEFFVRPPPVLRP